MQVHEAINHVQTRLVNLAQSPKTQPADFQTLEADCANFLNLWPDHPALLFYQGTISVNLDRAGVGIALLHRAIATGANSSGAWINLGGAYKKEHLDRQAEDCFHNAIALAEKENSKEDMVLALNSMATLHVNAGRPADCIKWADKALALDNHPSALWNKGLALLEAGQWAEGWAIYDEAGFKLQNMDLGKRKLKTYGGLPQWDGTKGQTVIVYGEQGIGDEVMLASILPDFTKDCRVILDCDPRLLALFKRSFPLLEAAYPTSEVNAPFEWIKDHKIDAQISMGSLGRHYRNSSEAFPKTRFLETDQAKRLKWRDALAPFKGLKVGLSYVGGHKATRQDKRSIPLMQWADILKVPGCDFFSLQYHPWAEDDAAATGSSLGVPIHCWRDAIAQYDETAAFIDELDLVITVNTSLHHLAGALAAPQICLTPKYCAWRYGAKGPSPWYANCDMARQNDDGEWLPPLRHAQYRVEKLAKQKAKAGAMQVAA